MSRIRVAILRGGLSDEYKVSLWTGATVLENIDKSLFEPIDIVITKNGEWLCDGRLRLPEHVLHSVDVVFNALHGRFGEDGTVQRLLERFAVPYTGSKAFASSVAMNKVTTKNFLKDTDVKVAKHIHVTKDSVADIARVSERIVDLFGPQYVIKPVSSGSSVGTMMVKNPLLLPQALKDALEHFDEVMVEARIPGREATCGVIDRYRGEELYALPPIEIVIPERSEFFNEEVKYDGTTQEICPGRFDRSTKNEIERVSKLVHTTLNLSQYSRSDFIISDDGIYFLEVNTLPGLTKESLFPRAIQTVGGTYSEFITHLLTDALNVKNH
ncbi:MAG: D-alanine--D-alanine ligase [Candidatus Pacebacteria bacterium]|nr:D-alanine--D-alanine ligase [Candidatus Paceibacterota bacterium]MCF7857023.1 D-alanine--D-alanine ligase [Candidatus Paceibacterota bacterium]